MYLKAIGLLVIFLRFCNVTSECNVVLNEINVENGLVPESMEFLELKKINCPVNSDDILKHYFLIMVQEYDIKTKSATIIFSADLIHSQFRPSSNFFVVGNRNSLLNPNLEFSNNAVMYPGKKLMHSKKITYDLKSIQLNDLFNNGNHFAIGIILLKENPTTENARKILTFIKPAGAPLTITDSMKSVIVDHMVDIYVYSKRSFFNSC